MNYTKPYMWWTPTIPYKHYLIYKYKQRNTDFMTFWFGQHLPFNSGNPNISFTQKDPKEYDLIFHSEITIDKLKKYDILPNDQSFLLVNQKIKNILIELCPNDVQFFPAVIVPEYPDKMQFENHDYWVLNIARLVDVFNKEESEFKYFDDGDIRGIIKLNFQNEYKESFYIARQSTNKSSIIVSPELVKRFKKEKVTGVKFLKDSEYGR